MNQTYNVIWNASQGTWQAVSELAKRQGQRSTSNGTMVNAAASVWRPALNALSLAVSAGVMLMAASSAYAVTAAAVTYTSDSPTIDAGTTYSGTTIGAETDGTIGTLTNNGTISGTSYGLYNDSGSTIASIVNSGLMNGTAYSGIDNEGEIDAITNNGSIVGSLYAVYNTGTIGVLTNTLQLTGNYGVLNLGTIGTIDNQGTFTANNNSGVWNEGGSITSIVNEAGATIYAHNTGIRNTGTIDSISNAGTINGSTFAAIDNTPGIIGSISNTGLMEGAEYGIYNGTVSSSIGTIDNSGTIAGTLSTASYGVYNVGTIGTIDNSGEISGYVGIINGTTGTIDSISNTALISGSAFGVDNQGTLGTLSNSGTINGSTDGIYNIGSIDTIDNSGTITGEEGIYTGGTIGSLSNSGAITATEYAIDNEGSIGTLGNTGTISGQVGLLNYGTIDSISNEGTWSSYVAGIENGGGIGTIDNSGVITGDYGVYNAATIGSINNSGTITGSGYAIDNTEGGSIGSITNSGVIAGNILNASTNTLTISGGTGTIFGTLTGYDDTSGTITSENADLVFDSGNLLLNDSIDVGSNTVYNNSATLEVDGITTITGNYSQGQAATLLIGVSSGATTTGSLTDTGYGRLVVSGDATIASGSSVELKSTTGGYSFAAGQRFVVVDATGTGTYNESTLNYSIAGVTATLTGTSVTTTDGHTDLVVTVDSVGTTTTSGGGDSSGSSSSGSSSTSTTDYAKVATQANAERALTGLLGYTGVSNAALLNLYDAAISSLSDGSSSSANQLGKQLGPLQTQYAGSAATLDAMGVVGAHIDALRIAHSSGATGLSTGDSPTHWTTWAQAFGGHASQDERDNTDGYSANYGGLLIGADRSFGDKWRVGAAFDYSHTAIDFNGSDSGDSAGVNAYGLIGYASFSGEPWYVNLSGAATLQHFDTTRAVTMTGYSGVADGSFSGQQYVARAETGWPLAIAGMTLTPLASLTYSYLNEAGYTETGGNGAALTIGSEHSNSVRSALGAKLEKSFSTSYGELVPELRAQWVHDYNRTRQTTSASFAADTTGETAFTTLAASPISNLADISIGVTLVRANNMSLSARYELQAGSGFISNTGILRVQQRF
ncbi:autotransporter domain-containing protein [Paraburkholderia sp. J67]|uniref:autotransporter domain-containing protein n=1 Tax=Paraburkholderia sp. J67 TaxID=2805435 RepID=UPI002ABDC85F|nr:autotransporter domain-containing protein [Paraburkholderia sp. J67]